MPPVASDVVTADIQSPQRVVCDIGAVFCIDVSRREYPPWMRGRGRMVKTNADLSTTTPNNRNAVSNPRTIRSRIIIAVPMI